MSNFEIGPTGCYSIFFVILFILILVFLLATRLFVFFLTNPIGLMIMFGGLVYYVIRKNKVKTVKNKSDVEYEFIEDDEDE